MSLRSFLLTGNTTAIRRTAVRETGLSRYHGGKIEGPPDVPSASQHSIVLRGLRGFCNWVLFMPRGASLSDRKCEFFQSMFSDKFLSHFMCTYLESSLTQSQPVYIKQTNKFIDMNKQYKYTKDPRTNINSRQAYSKSKYCNSREFTYLYFYHILCMLIWRVL